ncbi:MAG TPA: DinB family protein [bacterium]|nr:DinB family protein [bacterium]
MASPRKRAPRKPRKNGKGSLHEWVLLHCRQTYQRRNWAGKGVLPAIKGVTAEQAHWRPQPDQHNIAEIALHMGYWKDRVTAGLTGRKWKYSDADNWRTVPHTDAGWSAAQTELEAAQRRLMQGIRGLAPSRLMERAVGPWKWLDFIVDIATHDSYHAAQIFVIRRLFSGRLTQT